MPCGFMKPYMVMLMEGAVPGGSFTTKCVLLDTTVIYKSQETYRGVAAKLISDTTSGILPKKSSCG